MSSTPELIQIIAPCQCWDRCGNITVEFLPLAKCSLGLLKELSCGEIAQQFHEEYERLAFKVDSGNPIPGHVVRYYFVYNVI